VLPHLSYHTLEQSPLFEAEWPDVWHLPLGFGIAAIRAPLLQPSRYFIQEEEIQHSEQDKKYQQ
jgi:hypothetical protein